MTPFHELSPPYSTIVADPPWSPSLKGQLKAWDKASPQHRYSTMSVEDIESLPVATIAAEQAHLYLWCLTPDADWGFRVARAWGFAPVTMLTWCKPGLGVGRFRCNTEHVVVARRGERSGNPFGFMGSTGQATDGTWFQWPRGSHSEKPAAFFDIVERISPGPYIELFARQPRLGWDSWGYGYEVAS